MWTIIIICVVAMEICGFTVAHNNAKRMKEEAEKKGVPVSELYHYTNDKKPKIKDIYQFSRDTAGMNRKDVLRDIKRGRWAK